MTLDSIIERLEKAEGGDQELDFWISVRAYDPCDCTDAELQADIDSVGIEGMHIDAAFTSSVDAAIALAEKVLPGWAWRVATCSVSDDAWVLPDFNCPVHGERLKREVPIDIDWADFTDVDLRPPGRPAIALCISILTAVEALKAKQMGVGE